MELFLKRVFDKKKTAHNSYAKQLITVVGYAKQPFKASLN